MSGEGIRSNLYRYSAGLGAGITIGIVTALVYPVLSMYLIFSLPLPPYTVCESSFVWLERACLGVWTALESNLPAAIALSCLCWLMAVPRRFGWSSVIAGYAGVFVATGWLDSISHLALFRIAESLFSANPNLLSYTWTHNIIFVLMTALVFRGFYGQSARTGVLASILHRPVVTKPMYYSTAGRWILNVLTTISAAFLTGVVMLSAVILLSVPPFAQLHESTFNGLDLIKVLTLVPLSVLLLTYLGRFRMEAARGRVARFERWFYSKGTFIAALFVVSMPLLMTGAGYLIGLL